MLFERQGSHYKLELFYYLFHLFMHRVLIFLMGFSSLFSVNKSLFCLSDLNFVMRLFPQLIHFLLRNHINLSLHKKSSSSSRKTSVFKKLNVSLIYISLKNKMIPIFPPSPKKRKFWGYSKTSLRRNVFEMEISFRFKRFLLVRDSGENMLQFVCNSIFIMRTTYK